MIAELLLNQLRGLGISVTVKGEKLAVRPASALTPELSAAIREHKPELLAILSLRLCHNCHERPVDGGSHFCVECRIGFAGDDPTAFECFTCGQPARRLGNHLDQDGRGRYGCPANAHKVLWRRPNSDRQERSSDEGMTDDD